MQPKVKICGITNVADARVATEAGADALGFMFFEGSVRHVTVPQVAEISREISPFVLRVGVFVNPDPELVFQAVAECGLNLLQFHGEETPEFCQQFGVMTMKAFRIKDEESLARLPAYRTNAWLLDSYVPGKQGGTGAQFNWDLAIAAARFGRPIFLAGGLTPHNVADAVARVQPYGVDVSSGVEASLGKKDPVKVRAFIAAAKGTAATDHLA